MKAFACIPTVHELKEVIRGFQANELSQCSRAILQRHELTARADKQTWTRVAYFKVKDRFAFTHDLGGKQTHTRVLLTPRWNVPNVSKVRNERRSSEIGQSPHEVRQ